MTNISPLPSAISASSAVKRLIAFPLAKSSISKLGLFWRFLDDLHMPMWFAGLVALRQF